MSAPIAKFFDSTERPPRGGWVARVEGIEYQGNSESDLIDKVRRNWQNNARTFDPSEPAQAVWRWFRSVEPTRATIITSSLQIDSADGSVPFDWKGGEGPKKWRELHTHAAALVRDGALNEANERNWLDYFARSIGCDDCRLNWQTELGKLPPDYSSPAAFFAWSVAIHNSVSARIGKAQFSLESAQELYSLT